MSHMQHFMYERDESTRSLNTEKTEKWKEKPAHCNEMDTQCYSII